jgi:hypothetical protein
MMELAMNTNTAETTIGISNDSTGTMGPSFALHSSATRYGGQARARYNYLPSTCRTPRVREYR